MGNGLRSRTRSGRRAGRSFPIVSSIAGSLWFRANVGENVVAIGTTRIPKVRAVERALEELRGRFPDFLPGTLRLETRKVSSGVAETPRSTDETMRGARTRALAAFESLRSEGDSPSLGIGLEGGVSRDGGASFLESWSYVTDGTRGYFGGSGAMPLPDGLAERVLVSGGSLGEAADRYFGRTEVAAGEGTFGLLTRMVVSREDAFLRSLIHALAPFYNLAHYL
jgi:inosine/xanthosine triphosphatase